MRLLITGGSGYLGRHLVPLAASRAAALVHTYYRNAPAHAPGAHQLDVCDAEAVKALARDFGPDVIIHTAGSSGRPDMAQVIQQGARHVTEAASETRARLIHLSTDVVFDGRHAPYREEDPPRPIHDYGRAKAEAEKIIARHDNHVIMRTSLIYGFRVMDHSTAWIVAALRRHVPVTLFVDQIRNPVWVTSLCQASIELANLQFCGILHVAGSQSLSRAEFGLRMLDWWSVDERSSLAVGPGDGTRWPADCTLDISRAQSLLQTPLPGVDEVLQTHLAAESQKERNNT